MRNVGRVFKTLREHGVTRAMWHPDGELASVEFGPLPTVVQIATRGKAGTVTRIVRDDGTNREPEPREDLDALGDVLPAYDRSGA